MDAIHVAILGALRFHRKALAIMAPPQIPTNPKIRLRTTYDEAMRNAPVCRLVNISHSKVENVLYAPTNPIGRRKRQAGFSSVWLPRRVRTNPMIKHAVMLITKVP